MPPVSPREKPCSLTPAGGRTRAALRAAVLHPRLFMVSVVGLSVG